MKRSVKILLAVLALVLVAGGVGLGFALGRGNGSNIAREEALNIALDQAGLSKSDVNDIDIELERRRGGNARYEVDFEYLGTDYDCFIDAATGQVLAFSGPAANTAGGFQSFGQPQSQAPANAPAEAPVNAPAPAQAPAAPDTPAAPETSTAPEGSISREEALKIALADVGLEESQVYDLSIEQDRKKGTAVYEVDFDTEDTEFDYTIDAATGAITRMDSSPKQLLGQDAAAAAQQSEELIGRESALAAALADAGLAENDVYDIGIELDRRLRSVCYEVDFETASTEYEYDIDAVTGEVLNSRTEPNR